VPDLVVDSRRTIGEIWPGAIWDVGSHGFIFRMQPSVILFDLYFCHGTSVEVRFHHLGVKKTEPADADKWQCSLRNLRAEPPERWPARGIWKKLFQQARRVN
jgi:hypothetical protein